MPQLRLGRICDREPIKCHGCVPVILLKSQEEAVRTLERVDAERRERGEWPQEERKEALGFQEDIEPKVLG